MKDYLLQTIKEKLGDKYNLAPNNLALLKLNTPSSGLGTYGKVIFLVFKHNNVEPLLCVKTVRKVADNIVITKGFSKLQSLHQIIKNSPYVQMFPVPLLIDNDASGIAYSIESACPGRRPSQADLPYILESYNQYQSFLAKDHLSYQENFDLYIKDLLVSLSLLESDILDIYDYYQHSIKTSSDIKIALLPQHGDITLDNMFINEAGTHIFDCDRFGDIRLAGFDVFHFLHRILKNDNLALFKRYLLEHLAKIDNQSKLSPDLLFAYLLHEIFLKREVLPDKLNMDLIKREFSVLKLFL
ncbi:MAG: hypothetical protein Q8O32_03805 [bacterium]|nr:hypothetical protein [bacterium]